MRMAQYRIKAINFLINRFQEDMPRLDAKACYQEIKTSSEEIAPSNYALQ